MIPNTVTEAVARLRNKLDASKPRRTSIDVKDSRVLHSSWSKGPGFSVLPLGLELSGVKPSNLKKKEPSNKKMRSAMILGAPQ